MFHHWVYECVSLAGLSHLGTFRALHRSHRSSDTLIKGDIKSTPHGQIMMRDVKSSGAIYLSIAAHGLEAMLFIILVRSIMDHRNAGR